MTSFAQGGPPILGRVKSIMQIATTDNRATAKLYDPERDVLTFLPYMLLGVLNAFKSRSLPAIKEAFEANPELEKQLSAAYIALVTNLKNNTTRDYKTLVEEWIKASSPEIVDLILKVFGRALLEFYAVCAYDLTKPNEVLPGGMEVVLNKIITGEK